MTSTIVYATSTHTARMADTARRGINAVANAPVYLVMCSACEHYVTRGQAHVCPETDVYDVCANQSTCIVDGEGIECDLPADHAGDCDFTGCPCDLSR